MNCGVAVPIAQVFFYFYFFFASRSLFVNFAYFSLFIKHRLSFPYEKQKATSLFFFIYTFFLWRHAPSPGLPTSFHVPLRTWRVVWCCFSCYVIAWSRDVTPRHGFLRHLINFDRSFVCSRVLSPWGEFSSAGSVSRNRRIACCWNMSFLPLEFCFFVFDTQFDRETSHVLTKLGVEPV